MMPKVSVVIPVYNVEAFLQRCVDSVIHQTLEDIEIILVDDGSPDCCPEMCDQYASSDKRVKVIHKQNGGLASARNAGLNMAEAEYLFFLDSDDWLELDGLEILYKIAEEKSVDFVRYRAIRNGWPGLPENASCMVEPIRELEEGFYDRERIIKEVYPRLLATEELTMGSVVGAWGSLYRLEFLKTHNLKFYEDVKYSEDLVFSANVVRKSESFYYISEAGIYHYFYNIHSISKSFREDRWDSCKSLIRYCERDFMDVEEYDFSRQLHYLRWFCILLALNERKYILNKNKRLAYCRSIVKDPVILKTPLHLKWFRVSRNQKLLMIMVKLGMTNIISAYE